MLIIRRLVMWRWVESRAREREGEGKVESMEVGFGCWALRSEEGIRGMRKVSDSMYFPAIDRQLFAPQDRATYSSHPNGLFTQGLSRK
ncbi:hypothetical protein E2C01_081637 [Portunus trituberculatus]|uniref:Uncharacterized protein n=1 Tax=Portunus trituberculatus TaxID=210409 RepID=A0A5B7IQA6_PORTR|nr:hypothetical protein [Portunus trituberculatus]